MILAKADARTQLIMQGQVCAATIKSSVKRDEDALEADRRRYGEVRATAVLGRFMGAQRSVTNDPEPSSRGRRALHSLI